MSSEYSNTDPYRESAETIKLYDSIQCIAELAVQMLKVGVCDAPDGLVSLDHALAFLDEYRRMHQTRLADSILELGGELRQEILQDWNSLKRSCKRPE